MPGGEFPMFTGFLRDITERRQVEEARTRLAAIVESSDEAIIGKTLEGIITNWNRGAEALFGYSAEAAVGKPMAMLIPADRAHEEPEILARIARGEDVDHFETVRIRKDREQIDVSVSISPIKDTQGKIIGASNIARDITERRLAEREIRRLNEELEQRVADRTTQLHAANKELEAFSYSVSHDLRAPLREMAQLIDDLLQLARVTRSEMRREVVNLSETAHALVAELQEREPERTMTVRIEKGLAAYGDKRLLKIVLSNLLGNAWKFTSKQIQPEITFGSERENGETFYFARDNGAGFDMTYVNKLFGAFQRLHTAGEFEGTGVGLATVQRIINRHGGRVWAEGTVNEGATFYFTLPDFKEIEHGKQSDPAG